MRPRLLRSTARLSPNRCSKANSSVTKKGRSPARPVSARADSRPWPTAVPLFLDEVGEIPLTMQAKLLRVLQERRFERVGGSQTVEVDVRVVAATNRDLLRLAKDGKFREDLYYRLNVVKIDLPPLHERPEDITLLAEHFALKFSRQGGPPKQIAPEAMEALLQHRWPGNIRELENAIERACVTSRDEVVRPENLPTEILKPNRPRYQLSVDLTRPLTEQLAELTAAFEERYLRRALKRTRGHIRSEPPI